MKMKCRIATIEPRAETPHRLLTGEVRIDVDGRDITVSEEPLTVYRDLLRELYAMAFEGRSSAVVLTENFHERVFIDKTGDDVCVRITDKSSLDADAVLVFEGPFSELCNAIDKEFRGMLYAIKRSTPDALQRSDVLAFISPFPV